jgi:hypothetical protein
VTERTPIGSLRRGGWRALCVLLAAGMASSRASAGGMDVQARDAPRAAAASAATLAPPKGMGFAVTRHVIAAGGGRSSGGTFAITGTVGQADADPLQPSAGGVFAITGGFWPGTAHSAPPGDTVFADGFESPLLGR